MPSRARLHLRRNDLEPRIEMMPLIDVVFLLLTFFIYSMVLMVRAYLLPVELPGITQGEVGPSEVRAVSITMDSDGQLYLDAEPRGLGALMEEVRAVRAEDPEARIYVAADVQGSTDRLPAFIDLVNQLRTSGLDEFYIVGYPEEEVGVNGDGNGNE